jgi:hypothetical protein
MYIIIFQQDGAPPHFWTPVTKFLHEQFTEMWIGQDGSLSQPLYCLILSPLTISYGNTIRKKSMTFLICTVGSLTE